MSDNKDTEELFVEMCKIWKHRYNLKPVPMGVIEGMCVEAKAMIDQRSTAAIN